jgi:hypothetical protein
MKKIIAGVLATLTLTGGGVYYAAQPPKVKVQDPLTLKWERPTTDKEWNEDVKLEYVDIRGTATLETMLVAQKAKLEKQKKAFSKYEEMISAGLDPLQFLTYEWYAEFKTLQPQLTDEERMTEAKAQAEFVYNQEKWELEKIAQGIERIEKELELRRKGYVKIKGDKTPTDFFGAELPEVRVRTVID